MKDDIKDLLDKALLSPTPLELRFQTVKDMTAFRARLFRAKQKARKLNLKLTGEETSDYDNLSINTGTEGISLVIGFGNTKTFSEIEYELIEPKQPTGF